MKSQRTSDGRVSTFDQKSVMDAFAEFERALIRAGQREGVALAKQRGAYLGRKKAMTSCSRVRTC
ncbi:MAG: hypothetical protein ACYC4S_08900 [Rhodoferax sp.]